jgi:hypothetical protein
VSTPLVAAVSAPLRALARLLHGGRGPALHAAVAAVALLAALTALVVVAWHAPVRNNPASRLGTMECLVDHGEWSLDHAWHRYVTTDKVFVGGRFYSSKPPVYSAVGAVAYRAIRDVRGETLVQDVRGTVFWLRLLLHVLPFAIGAIVAARLLRREVASSHVWLWGVLAWFGGTFVFGYSGDINNHSLAALLVLAALAGALSLARGNDSGWVWAGTGFCAALAVTLDFGAGVFAVALGVFLLARARRLRYVWFVLGAQLPILVHAHLTVRVTGSIRPFYGMSNLYDYPGSYWRRPGNFDALDEPTWVYAFHALLGHHGLFAMTPLFLLAVPGLARLLRTRGERTLGLWLGGTVVTTILVYLFTGPRNYGGTAQGMRWFIVLAPLLWLLALRFADTRADRRWMRWLLPLLVLAGIVTAAQALDNPWSVSPWNWLLRDFGLGSVPPWRRLLPG